MSLGLIAFGNGFRICGLTRKHMDFLLLEIRERDGEMEAKKTQKSWKYYLKPLFTKGDIVIM